MKMISLVLYLRIILVAEVFFPPITLANSAENLTVSVDLKYLLSLDGDDFLKSIEDSCNSIFTSPTDDRMPCYRRLYCRALAIDNRTEALCYEPFDDTISDHILSHDADKYHPKYRYSSFTCMGGSQIIDDRKLRQSNTRNKFPLSDSQFRVCKFHNVCFKYGEYPSLLFFEDPEAKQSLPADFQLCNFKPTDHLHLGYVSYFTSSGMNKPFMPISYIDEPIPDSLFLHSDAQRVAMLVAHSWDNYGHHLMDVVIPMFTAALLYEIPISAIQPVFETNCKKFGLFRVEGEKNAVCASLVEQFATVLSDNYPVFLDDLNKPNKRVCFRTMIAGFGSAFGQGGFDLSRDISMRLFRNHVVKYLAEKGMLPNEEFDREKKAQILVLMRGRGANNISAPVELNDVLCSETIRAVRRLSLDDKYHVNCVKPEMLSFGEEVASAQRSKIIVSYHGTQAYTILFASDGTQVILMTEDIEDDYGKDFQIFSRLTFVHVFWLVRNRWVQDFSSLLSHAIRVQNS